MKKLASFILVLMLVLTLVPASFAEGERVAVICDPVGNNLFLTQAVDTAKSLSETYGYTKADGNPKAHRNTQRYWFVCS